MSATTMAAAYQRISDDREGRELGVARQRQDTDTLAERNGLTIVENFTENDTGASTRSRKPRPQYARMLQLAESGQVGVILAYSNSRLTRRPMEMEDLIRLHERTGVVIRTMVSGDDDLSTADGRMVARIKASVDAAEAERTGERVERYHLALREAGAPRMGSRPFGWRDDMSTLDPVEAQIMQEIVADVIAGKSVRRGVAKLREAGYQTTRKNEWKSQTLTQYLRNPRLVGHRTYKGKVFNNKDGDPVIGKWEPLLDQDTWDRLQVALQRPTLGARKGRKNARQHLLTGVLRCSACNGPLYGDANVKNGASKPRYACTQSSDGHSNTIIAGPVENLIHSLVVTKLDQDAIDAPPPPTWGRKFELTELESTLNKTMDQLGQGKISPEKIFAAAERLEKQIATLKAERDKWIVETTGPSTRGTTSEEYLAQMKDVQRGVIEKYFSAIYIRPMIKQQKRFDPERVVPVWREDD